MGNLDLDYDALNRHFSKIKKQDNDSLRHQYALRNLAAWEEMTPEGIRGCKLTPQMKGVVKSRIATFPMRRVLVSNDSLKIHTVAYYMIGSLIKRGMIIPSKVCTVTLDEAVYSFRGIGDAARTVKEKIFDPKNQLILIEQARPPAVTDVTGNYEEFFEALIRFLELNSKISCIVVYPTKTKRGVIFSTDSDKSNFIRSILDSSNKKEE